MSQKLLTHLTEVKALPVITLGQLITCLKGEALVMVCLISILPFMQPIPIPGLSSVLGIIALLQGVGLMFLREPLLTAKMKRMEIPPDKFELIYKAATKFISFTDRISVYQHAWTTSRACHFICGLAIVLSAAFLSLPLPIPFSNFVPALSIAFLCIGLLEEDLVLIIVGLSITAVVMWMGVFSFHFLMEQVRAYF